MPRQITSATTLDNLRKEAKRWLKALRAGDAEARERFQSAYPTHEGEAGLRDVQHALAREYGMEGWNALKDALRKHSTSTRTLADYEQAARDFIASYTEDAAALERLNAFYERSFTFADVKAEIWRRNYAFRQRAFKLGHGNYLPEEEARIIVANDAGFGKWEALARALETGAPPQGPPYAIDSKENRIGPSRRMSEADWDELISVMKERRITGLGANGLMTDRAMARIAELDFVTRLDLSGSREMSDDGLQMLARMPQLDLLHLNEYPGGKLTARGLEVLRRLPILRRFEMTWQAGITDAGVANLRHCEKLEHVDLMGSPTGDGAIEALQGKAHLRWFSMGRLATAAGVRLLHGFPLMKTKDGDGSRVLVDGPVGDEGLAALAGLEGLVDLDLFWHVDKTTPDGFRHLVQLPNLQVLGCDGELSSDRAMAYIGSIPRLKALRAQESTATDDGFVALSKSRTLEGFWGRVCPNFGSRGFLAFSRMPSLQKLGIGCASVDDAALAALPEFPSLRELTPVGFTDDGFRHIGRCERLERLTCMYCRETGDGATEHIRGLGIRYYYAGLTQITDRSLEILGGMDSLEQVDLYECAKVTDAGLPALARLPKLREVHLDGCPSLSYDGTRVFGAGVRVYYST
jgi:hypothetical protein